VNNAIAKGNGNTIMGSNNKIIGSANYVIGSKNIIKGHYNRIEGNNNLCDGDFNVCEGNDITTCGHSNKCTGSGWKETKNEKVCKLTNTNVPEKRQNAKTRQRDSTRTMTTTTTTSSFTSSRGNTLNVVIGTPVPSWSPFGFVDHLDSYDPVFPSMFGLMGNLLGGRPTSQKAPDPITAHISDKQDTTAELDGEACSICLTNKKVVMIVPCGHMCLCRTCSREFAASLSKSEKRACPLCREDIREIIEVYT
jgi:hypothetical protein